MNSRFAFWIVCLSVLSLPAFAAQDIGVPATPPGVTIKVVRIGQAVLVPGSNGNQPRDRIIFADNKGGTLYESAQDQVANQSACIGECATNWPPFLAAANAKPAGDWTLVPRPDGAKQWAFRGKPLYTYAKDAAPKSSGAADAVGARPAFVSLTNGHDVDGHHVVEIRPETWTTLPAGISIQEVRTAPGQVLTTERGQTLYVFAGKAEDPSLNHDWAPFPAPQIALPVGDFTVVARSDGGHQWAYKGRPLFTFKGDLDYGDSNGKYAGGAFQVAYVLRYFMPANVAVRKNHAFGGLLTTTDNQTLYARENGIDGADGAQRAERGNPNTGMTIGLTGCDAACERTWRPLVAPADAAPSGYWSIYDRADGKKQWAYYGYALYTMAGESPGQMNGHLIYDDVDNYELLADGSARQFLRLRWRVAPP